MSMTNRIELRSKNIELKILENSRALVSSFFQQSCIIAKTQQIEYQNDDVKSGIILIEADKASDLGWISAKWVDNESEIQSVIMSKKEIEYLHQLPAVGREDILQVAVKQLICRLLALVTGVVLPWGILTGIRPGKLISSMNKLGLSKAEQDIILSKKYLVMPAKIQLLQKISAMQDLCHINTKKQQQLVSLYISVPFCPSRCSYCSFTFDYNGGQSSILGKYMETLIKEIKLTGNLFKEASVKVNKVYIGGGTPTILELYQLETLLNSIREFIPMAEETEYTVEAGRPDTINEEKLLCFKKYKVNRLSINPQTMNEQTLIKIGRRHTVQNIIEIYHLARKTGNWIINMDIILGLPDEGRTEVQKTIRAVLDLKPDNISVHALSIKRRSKQWETGVSINRGMLWQEIQEAAFSDIQEAGYEPYYMYRQKNIVGNLENVGFCLPEKESRYNIAVIEENENIIGLGAGACSKIRAKDGLSHQNIYQPNDILTYIHGFELVHAKRSKLFNSSVIKQNMV